MKAKLKKENSQYNLYLDNDMIASTYPYQNQKMLSRQNCDEIFGVVDVEKLADSIFEKESSNMLHPQHQMRNTFILGFNKAMELNKDKMFTVEDMYDAVMIGVSFEDPGIEGISTYKEAQELAVKRFLPPTEIEVVIETETKVWECISNGEFESFEIIPKLDSEGCLILKKI
jgi:hypothetical protein